MLHKLYFKKQTTYVVPTLDLMNPMVKPIRSFLQHYCRTNLGLDYVRRCQIKRTNLGLT